MSRNSRKRNQQRKRKQKPRQGGAPSRPPGFIQHEQPWDGNTYVELSWRQFHDAYDRVTTATDEVGEGFDYWLYVVELVTPGNYRVIPICNPARRAGKFEFRGGTWRIMGERE